MGEAQSYVPLKNRIKIKKGTFSKAEIVKSRETTNDSSTLNDYQAVAMSTAIYPNDRTISYLALALCEEAGEVAGKVKKVIRDKAGEFSDADKRAIALELGDCLWYIANQANAIGYKLSDIAEMNRIKIEGRVQRGTLHGSGDNR